VLSEDIFTVAPGAIEEVSVTATVVGGRVMAGGF